ncbi:MAG: hypothetical protein FWC39_08405, partial [Bacteroidetes bacterium]|nr:hypothetical protein [Bacteroidota bacterium]
MSMKSILRSIMCTMSAVLLFSTGLFAQANLLISGGNAVSSYLCSNSFVTVWGKNDAGQLGLGTSGAPVTTPTVMPMTKFATTDKPGGQLIQQVNSGSGQHFVALTCKDAAGKTEVWAWGSNDRGQIGNGVKGGVVAAPVRVRASTGIDAAYRENVGGVNYLINAKVVYAGNSNTFAILNNGDLVSWGGNGAGANQYTHTYGQLGDGTQTDRYEAVYVLRAAGQRLQNVTTICAGDNAAYALDANGQVWSWGWSQSAGNPGPTTAGNGALGRADGQTNWATQVRYANQDGSGAGLMNNIIYLSCSDGGAFAIDNNNYVWAWGNGGWGNSLGLGNNQGGWEPRRVRNVGTTGNPNDYLQAKQVAGGQGFGMAVTLDGRAVVWGGSGTCGVSGHGGGGGTIAGLTNDSNARYITSPANAKDSVVLINRADHGGWFVTASGRVFAFGCNQNADAGVTGMLGTGSTADVPTPTQITMPGGCSLRDLPPTVDISPKDYEVCASQFNGIEINSGFGIIKTSGASPYHIQWYKDGVLIKQSTKDGPWGVAAGTTVNSANWAKKLTAAEVKAAGAGVYKVVVTYTGANAGCNPPPPVEAQMTVKFFTQEFEDPGTLKVDCTAKTATVNVKAKSPANITGRVYNWYTACSGGTPIATTSGSGTTTLTTANLAALSYSNAYNDASCTIKKTCNSADTKLVWVEEVAKSSGVLFGKPTGATATSNETSDNRYGLDGNRIFTGIVVNEPIIITEMSFMVKACFDKNSGGTAPMTISIYNTKDVGGNPVPNAVVSSYGSLTVTYEKTNATNTDNVCSNDEVTAKGTITLPPGTYFIGISALSTTTTSGGGIKELKFFRPGGAAAANDGLTPNAVTHPANMTANMYNGNQGNLSMFFDIKFTTGQKFCDRVPVCIKEDCPTCTASKDPVITPDSGPGTPAYNSQSNTVTLCEGGPSVTLRTNNVNPGSYSNYTIEWYKGGKAVGNRVRTQNFGPTPTNANVSDTWTVGYSDVTETGTTYYVRVNDRAEPTEEKCIKWAEIIVKRQPKPVAQTIPNKSYCADGTTKNDALTLVSTPTGATFTWTNNNTATGIAASGTSSPVPQYTLTNTGTTAITSIIKATPTLNGCAGDETTITTITVNPKPTLVFAGGAQKDQSVCIGTAISNIGFTLGGGAHTPTLDATATSRGLSLSGNNVTGTPTGTGTIPYTVTAKAVNSGTAGACPDVTITGTITINPLPTVTLSGEATYCQGNTINPIVATFANGKAPYSFTATSTAGAGGVTSGQATAANSNKANLTGATLPSAPGDYTYTLSTFKDDNGCVGNMALVSPASQKITINPEPKATMQATPKTAYCAGSASGITLSLTAASGVNLSQGTVSYAWTPSGSGASITNATKGTYNVTISQTINGKTCTSTAGPITITENPQPTYTITGNGEYCPTETNRTPVVITFTGAAPITFDIANKSDFSASGGGLIYTSTAATGANSPGQKYQPTNIKDANGCDAVANTASVTVTNKTVVGLTYDNGIAPICFGTQSSVDIKNHILTADKSKLTFAMKPGSPGTVNSSGVLTLNAATATNYYVIATLPAQPGETCPSEIEIPVTTLPLPTATITKQDVCFGTVSQLTANPTGGTGGFSGGKSKYEWTISAPGSLDNAAVAAPKIPGTVQAGIYTVGLTVTDFEGCKAATAATATVTIHAIPVIDFTAPGPFCAGATAANITATVTPSTLVTGGTGTWTGATKTSETAATFDPTTATGSPFTIKYDFTSSAANGSCPAVQVSKTVTVNPNPTFTIAPSKISACEFDAFNPNVPITMIVTPTSPTTASQMGNAAGYAYSGAVNINPLTGAFDSKDQSGTKTIKLNYTDANGCKGEATTTFSIDPLPVVKFTGNPAEVCYSAGEITLGVNIPGGTFSGGGVNSSTGKFTAMVAGGTHTFNYAYTDAKGCKGEDNLTIKSIFVEAPGNVSQSAMVTASNVLAAGSVTDITVVQPAATDGVDWFNVPAAASIFTGTVYATGVNDGNVMTYAPFPKDLNYITRAFKTVGGNKCYSADATAKLTITQCPAEPPVAKDPFYCVGDHGAVTATATGSNVSWFSVDVSASTNPSPAGLLNAGNTLSASGMTTAAAATKTVYAASYDATAQCWSIATPVTITIKDLPLVSIAPANANICAATETGKFNVTPALPGGTLSAQSGTGLNLTTGVWTPETDKTSSVTARYTVTETWGTNAATQVPVTCTNHADATITAHFTPAPTPVDKTWALSSIATIPAGHMTATVAAPGVKVNWYKSDKTTPITADNANGTAMTPDRAALQAAVDARPPAQADDNYTEDYWISQTDANGCESEKVKVTLTLVSCEFAQPEVTGVELCADGTLTNMTAKVPAATLGITGFDPTSITWKWYNADRTVANSGNGNGTANSAYKPAIMPAAGTTTYYVEYEAVIPNSGGNKCKMEQAVTITVNPLPTPAFGTNPIEMCQGEPAITLNVSPTTGGTGVFTGDATSATFNPTKLGKNTITYTFTDDKSCKNSASYDITVISIADPVVTPANNPKVLVRSSLGVLNGTTELDAQANAAADKVLWLDFTTSAQLAKDTYTYQTGLNDASAAGTYPYHVQSYRVIDNGDRTCYSGKVQASLTITDCPAIAPVVKNAHYCLGETNPKLTAETFVTAGNVAWFTTDPGGKMGENLGIAGEGGLNRLETGIVYNSANKNKGQQTVYVAEYDKVNNCWSVGAAVTIDIHDNPVPQVAASKPDFCAANEVVTFTLTPDPNTFGSNVKTSFTQTTTTFGGFNSATRSWDAMADPWNVNLADNSTAERTIEVTYKIDETHGSTAEIQATCTAQKVEKTTAQFMVAPPAMPDKYWLIGDITNIPGYFMEAITSSTGTKVAWYDTDKTTSLASNSLTLDPDRPKIQSEVPNNAEEFTKKYYVTQRNPLGCESEKTEVRLILVKCPFQPPVVTPNEKCKKELPVTGMALQAAKPATTAETPTKWLWYTSETGNTLASGAPTTAGISSTFSSTEKATVTYWVSYMAVEQSSQQECESRRTPVTLTVHTDPVITKLLPSKQVYCSDDKYADGLITPTVMWGAAGDVKKSDKWSIENKLPGEGIDAAGYFNASTWGDLTADYTIIYVVENSKGCKDTLPLVVPVQFSPVPTIKDEGYFAAPNASATVTLTAQGLGASNPAAGGHPHSGVNWYRTATSLVVLSTGNPSYTSPDRGTIGNPNPIKGNDIIVPGEKFYATQVIRGCESKRVEGTVIINCPVPAPSTKDRIICTYFDHPELTVTKGAWPTYPDAGTRPAGNTEVFNFYNANGTLAGTADHTGKLTLTNYNRNVGEVTFQVKEKNTFQIGTQTATCESPATPITVFIRDVDAVTIDPPASICEYDPTKQFNASNVATGALVEWYYDTAPNEPNRVQGHETPSNGSGNPFMPKFNGKTDGPGSYTIWATQRHSFTGLGSAVDNVSCVSKSATATLVIKPKPVPPVLTGSENCYGDVDKNPLTANVNANWFNRNGVLQNATPTNSFIPVETAPNLVPPHTYLYKASQTVNGCNSDTVEVYYRIKEIPK